MAKSLPTIINTRSGDSAETTSDCFRAAGFKVCEIPMREMVSLLENNELVRLLDDARAMGQVLALLSPNAVRCLAGVPRAILKAQRIALLGPGCALALAELEIEPCFVGSGGNGQLFASELLTQIDKSQGVLLLQSRIGRPEFATALSDAEVRVAVHALYDYRENANAKEALRSALAADPDAIVLAYAPSVLSSILSAFGGSEEIPRIASIGATTTQACQDAGRKVFCQAKQASNSALLAAINAQLGRTPA